VVGLRYGQHLPIATRRALEALGEFRVIEVGRELAKFEGYAAPAAVALASRDQRCAKFDSETCGDRLLAATKRDGKTIKMK